MMPASSGAGYRSLLPVGVLDGGPPSWVDEAGSVLLDGVSVQWWIGAEDRWHRPEREVAVRRTLLDGAPVVQTALRIPGGDARVHCYGVVVGGGEWVLLDIRNDSRTPVSVALVATADGPPAGSVPRGINRADGGPRDAAWRHDGARLWLDGCVLAVANRRADGFCEGADADTVAALLEAGQGRVLAGGGAGNGDAEPAGAKQAGELQAGAVAVIFAVAHGTGVRLLVAPGPHRRATDAEPLSAPAPEAVIRGWRRQLDAGCRVRLPDDAVEEAVFERRCRLVLAGHTGGADAAEGDTAEHAAASAAAISALAGFGHGRRAARLLDGLLSSLQAPVPAATAEALLVAAADVVAWAEDGTDGARLAELLGGPALELAGWAGRTGRRGLLRRPVARGEDTTAMVVAWAMARLLGPVEGRLRNGGPAPWDERTSQAVAAHRARSIAGDSDASALLAVRRQLVVDDDPSGIDLLAGWQDSWRGRPLEAHAVPTRFGPLSFALRWHGARPALLWQLEGASAPGAAGDGEPVLRCRALDPAFAARRAEGEALLAEPRAAADGGGGA